MKLSNLMYLFYFLKKTDWNKLSSHRTYIMNKSNISGFRLDVDMIMCTLRYGLSFHEYYYYGLWEKAAAQRSEYASMGYMYEFQKIFNPINTRVVLSDKNKFNIAYAEFLHRKIINPILSPQIIIDEFLQGQEKAVLKKSNGSQGKDVEIIRIADMPSNALKQYAELKQYDILEEFVYQHEDMQKISPNSLNTVRFITFLKRNGEVVVIGSSLRMGIDKPTDNLSSGGITCKIDTDNGVIASKGCSFDITQPLYDVHPVSGLKLEGFKIPYWNEVRSMCLKAASKYNDNRCIGWDVAITNEGPLLIEGNHDWGARVWQMPAGKGLKTILDGFLKDEII